MAPGGAAQEGSDSRRLLTEEVAIPAALAPIVLGGRHRALRLLREAARVRLSERGEAVLLAGEPAEVARAASLLRAIIELARRAGRLDEQDLADLFAGQAPPPSAGDGRLPTFHPQRYVVPRSPGQRRYLELARENDLTICVGCAGTGKTYLAVALFAAALKERALERIILVRPVLEAGEKLGFLPGDIQAKVNPYLRPLYDALADVMEPPRMRKLLEQETIEIAPLAYMRGRTLERAGIILDEGQNCTVRQMKMFLTRLGRQSRCIITGDVTQIDLPPDSPSGLVDAQRRLAGLPRVAVVELGLADVVRHPLVRDIVRAYGEPAAPAAAEAADHED